MTTFRRLSAAFAAALLLFSTQADVYASSHCAHHAAQAPAPEEPAGHGHHGDHGAPAEQEQHSGVCTCLGVCASSSVVAIQTAPAPVLSFAPSSNVVPFSATPEAALPGFNHHLIPFATAPPFFS